jgi:hypothetical protein
MKHSWGDPSDERADSDDVLDRDQNDASRKEVGFGFPPHASWIVM